MQAQTLKSGSKSAVSKKLWRWYKQFIQMCWLFRAPTQEAMDSLVAPHSLPSCQKSRTRWMRFHNHNHNKDINNLIPTTHPPS